MKYCKECNKKLRLFEGYIHPTMEKKSLLCSTCYDDVSSSVQKWSNFVKSNSFIISKKSNYDLLHECKDNLTASHINYLSTSFKKI